MISFGILHGDCLNLMPTLDPDSIDAIVTDPPYGLSFMGKHWDHGVPGVEFWQAALTVAKPGAHLLAFGGTRTFHRLAVAIEDAGWEMRDTVMWVYGSGFPKSHDVSKAIDREAGAQREVVGQRMYADGHVQNSNPTKLNPPIGTFQRTQDNRLETAPATPEAQAWSGWGTGLKPAWEPILVARKPFPGTVAQNVLTYGTGAINVDACRVESGADYHDAGPQVRFGHTSGNRAHGDSRPWIEKQIKAGLPVKVSVSSALGRWPANLIHDGSDEVIELFPESQSGTYKGPNARFRKSHKLVASWGTSNAPDNYGDGGSAARFFYCAKASVSDREEGLEGFEQRMAHTMNEYTQPSAGRTADKNGGFKRNHHPTVKPTDLMRYLIRLVTPPNGTVLDPFTGSGSTGKAAALEGFNFLGIEQDAEFVAIANARITHALAQAAAQRPAPTLFDQEA